MIRVTQFLHGHLEEYEGSNETFLSEVCGFFFMFLRFLEDSEGLK